MDFSAFAARRTATLGIGMAHWAGPIAPVVAANQIMELDRISGERLSLRIIPALTGSSQAPSRERTISAIIAGLTSI
jgi:alkanesulfonate monooxygenase SsuD/methylene tetrahydromethanopterin reductase-like flavin-dependent oxidoreductase (luciferase family)